MKIAVIGAGSWGTALAVHLTRQEHSVVLWSRQGSIAEEVRSTRTNSTYLSGVEMPPGLQATSDLGAAIQNAEAVFVAVPSQFWRDVYRAVAPGVSSRTIVVSTTKGLELDTLCRMSEIAQQETPGCPLAVLSGPSFAAEVAREQPTAVVIASTDLVVAEAVQRIVSGRTFRAYSSDDVIGVECAGALKNVIAIAAGLVDGLGYGHNTVAALITRGLAEISRLAVRLGGRADTLAGLAGLGDLVLTCTGELSRNRKLGQALGQGRSLADTQSEGTMVAEGVRTTRAACELADRMKVEMPIARTVRAVLYENLSPRQAVDDLMLRSLKRE